MERPGACHHARFMAKALYIAKITMTLHQLPANVISQEEGAAVKRMANFIALHYAKYWLQAPLTVEAPRIDLEFWRAMKMFEVGKHIKLLYNDFMFTYIYSNVYSRIILIMFVYFTGC